MNEPNRALCPEPGCLVTWVLSSIGLCDQGGEVTSWGPLTRLPNPTRATPRLQRVPLHAMPCPYSDTNTAQTRPREAWCIGAVALGPQSWVQTWVFPLTIAGPLHCASRGPVCTVGSFCHVLVGAPSGRHVYTRPVPAIP